MLTAAGTAQGFTLSTFADGFVSINSIGPVGIGFPNSGGVLVSDKDGSVRLFPTDTDGQHASSVSPVFPAGGIGDMAKAGGLIYMGQNGGATGDIVQLNDNGTLNHVVVSGLAKNVLGMATNPTNQHIFVATGSVSPGGGFVDLNPLTGGTKLFPSAWADGLSTDGLTLYAAYGGAGGGVAGYSLSDGATVFTSFVPFADGTALGTGALAGNIFVNTNSGTIVEVNLATNVQTVIASGGSRGDFVKVDPSNGTLILTQTDTVVRLTPPAGGGFVGGPAVPEPSSLCLFGTMTAAGLCGSALRNRARRRA
jgi:hypothetical protein